jgi:hypothetical protein
MTHDVTQGATIPPRRRAPAKVMVRHAIFTGQWCLVSPSIWIRLKATRFRALLSRGRSGQGTENHVQRHNSHSRKLTEKEVGRNAAIALIRAGVERYFAPCKRVWGMGRTRLKGPVRNRVWWAMAVVILNLTQADRLRQTCG